MGKGDRELLERLDANFRASLDHPSWRDFNEKALTAYRYREGQQWTAAELHELVDVRGQPATVNNQIKVTLDRLAGGFIQARTRVKYKARNPEAGPAADTLSEVFRYISQSSQLPYERLDCFRHGSCTGFGVMKADVEFNDLLKPEIRFTSIPPLEVFPDPYSRRYDWNQDAMFISHAKWLSFQDAKALYPEFEQEFSQMSADQSWGGVLSGTDAFRNDNYVDWTDNGRFARRVRVVEQWYKIRRKQSLLVLIDPASGQPIYLDQDEFSKAEVKQMLKDGARSFQRLKTELHMAVFTSGLLIEKSGPDPHGSDLFPFIPYFVDRKENGQPYSMVEVGIPMQDAINKRESKALHLINTNRVIVQKGAVDDLNQLANEVARPDGIIEVRNVEQILVNSNTEVAATQFQMHQEGKADYRRIVGVNPDAMGERSEVRSGAGIARKQAMTEAIIASVYDNFRRTDEILARVALHLIRHYYRAPDVFSIVDDLGKAQTVFYDDQHIAAVQQEIYDVVVSEVPDFTTRQEEQFQMLGEFLTRIPGNDPRALVLLQMSQIPDKEAIIQQFQQMMQPPPPEPKISLAIQWESLNPNEKAALAMQIGMQQLAMAQQQGTKPVAEIRQDTELAKAQLTHAGTMHKAQIQADTSNRQAGLKATVDLTGIQAKREVDLIGEMNGNRDQNSAQ